jgi:two-component system sensor histidine kinase RpfC
MPAEFASVIGLPSEKRLLYNALHSVLAGAETAAGTISLADYYQRKEPTRCYRVLVADDDPTNRTVISKQLELAGHSVTLVADGEQALDALGETDYDVVILDSHMPVMTGLEATRLIRVMQAGRAGVPIILFSADSTAETIREATDAGIDAFLSKPVEASRLYATLEQLAEKRAAEAARVVQAIAPPQPAQAPLLNTGTLRELARMSQDPQFVPHLVQLFSEDSSQLLMRIEEALSHHRREDFKAHIHALKGSALNLGAERLVAHCTRIGALDYRELGASAGSVAAETRAIITATHAALAEYVKHHSVAMS